MARGSTSGNGRRGPVHPEAAGGGRRVLELAPLERDCMNMLWPAGEATVRDIRDALAATRPRAYTTIMTIMDRLAHKGVVERRKVGKAYVYRPNLTEEQARSRAVEQLVENYFDGSPGALTSYLEGGTVTPRTAKRPPRPAPPEPRLGPAASGKARREPVARKIFSGPSMDDTLL